jgi:hypothetical protein
MVFVTRTVNFQHGNVFLLLVCCCQSQHKHLSLCRCTCVYTVHLLDDINFIVINQDLYSNFSFVSSRVFVTASVPHEVNQKEFKICEHESNPCTSKCPSNDECDSLEVDVDSGTRYTINWCELIDLVRPH